MYAGYLSEIREISRASAYKQVASLFKHPVERIVLWCKDKHRYNEERGPVDEFIEMIVAGGGELYACKLAYDMFKLKREDLDENVLDVITVGQLYEMSGGEGTQIIFT